MHLHEYVVAVFFQCIKLMIPLLSTYVMGLVFCFCLFFSPGMKRQELKWTELRQFSWCDLVNACLQLLVLRLGQSTPEKQWAGNLTAANFWCQPGNSAAEAWFSWRCLAMRARNSQASDLKPRLGWKCWQGKRKNLSTLKVWSLRHPYISVFCMQRVFRYF